MRIHLHRPYLGTAGPIWADIITVDLEAQVLVFTSTEEGGRIPLADIEQIIDAQTEDNERGR